MAARYWKQPAKALSLRLAEQDEVQGVLSTVRHSHLSAFGCRRTR